LVATGAPPRAARAIGKHAFGAEQLRRARGGQSFAAAWDAALELARERELAGLREGLTELAAEQEQERARRRSAILPRAQRDAAPDFAADPDAAPAAARPVPRLSPREQRRADELADVEAAEIDIAAAQRRIRLRLTNARRLLLRIIAEDPAKRAGWEALVGPTDWAKARLGQAQDDEPFDDAAPGEAPPGYSMRAPDMLLTAESGLLADLTGGDDPLDAMRRAVEPPAPDEADLSAEEQAAIAAYRAALKEQGWEEDEEGNLWSPDPPSAAE